MIYYGSVAPTGTNLEDGDTWFNDSTSPPTKMRYDNDRTGFCEELRAPSGFPLSWNFYNTYHRMTERTEQACLLRPVTDYREPRWTVPSNGIWVIAANDTYGMVIRDANNLVIYDSSRVTWLYVAQYTAPANTTITFTGVPFANEQIVIRQMVDDMIKDDESFVHTYVLSGSTLVATAPSTTTTQSTVFTILGR